MTKIVVIDGKKCRIDDVKQVVLDEDGSVYGFDAIRTAAATFPEYAPIIPFLQSEGIMI